MVAMDAGAHHVTAVERWLYLSLACKESLTTNGFAEDRFKVVYKRPTDLSLKQDVPILCNLMLCDILDEGEACTSSLLCCETFCLLACFRSPPDRSHLVKLTNSYLPCVFCPVASSFYPTGYCFADTASCCATLLTIQRQAFPGCGL